MHHIQLWAYGRVYGVDNIVEHVVEVEWNVGGFERNVQVALSYSPRCGRVQFTGMMLGMLAQFADGPERCHSVRPRKGRDTTITKQADGEKCATETPLSKSI